MDAVLVQDPRAKLTVDSVGIRSPAVCLELGILVAASNQQLTIWDLPKAVGQPFKRRGMCSVLDIDILREGSVSPDSLLFIPETDLAFTTSAWAWTDYKTCEAITKPLMVWSWFTCIWFIDLHLNLDMDMDIDSTFKSCFSKNPQVRSVLETGTNIPLSRMSVCPSQTLIGKMSGCGIQLFRWSAAHQWQKHHTISVSYPGWFMLCSRFTTTQLHVLEQHACFSKDQPCVLTTYAVPNLDLEEEEEGGGGRGDPVREHDIVQVCRTYLPTDINASSVHDMDLMPDNDGLVIANQSHVWWVSGNGHGHQVGHQVGLHHVHAIQNPNTDWPNPRLVSIPHMGVVLAWSEHGRTRYTFLASAVALAMQAMSQVRVAWMCSVARAKQAFAPVMV